MTGIPTSTAADLRGRVVQNFERQFGGAPTLVARAPGRVNLIGDHTDYNDGFVLPMAIDRSVFFALRPRDDGRVVVYSLDFAEPATFDVADSSGGAGAPAPGGGHRGWIEYVQGAAWSLREAGLAAEGGWDGVVAGDVPIGAGLSSSAALELATARGVAGMSGAPWDPIAMARLAQRAENEWVGVNCGIMDQLISAAGVAGHALLIDCRTLATHAVSIPPDIAVAILDSTTRRGLVDSAYNERRSQCEIAARFFGVPALRDVDVPAFEARASGLHPVIRRRARHVITENARTLAAAAALESGDVRRVGRLMNESHASLRDDFAVSRPELDTMVGLARAHADCYGARMTGAGFGGCAVALVARPAVSHFVTEVSARYSAATGVRPVVYVCDAAAGASLEMA